MLYAHILQAANASGETVAVLGVALLFLLIWGALLAVLWAGSLLLQSLFYSEADPQLYWRAPAAATALTVVLAFWGMLAYHAPENFQPWFLVNDSKTTEVSKLQARVRDDPGQWRSYFAHRTARGVIDYWTDETGRHMPMPPEAVRIEDNGAADEFLPQRNEKTGTFERDVDQQIVYRDDQGRTMTADQLGVVSESHSSVLLLNWVVSLGLLAAWFLSLWLLLRFQWPHALGLAAACWLTFTFFVQPMILSQMTA